MPANELFKNGQFTGSQEERIVPYRHSDETCVMQMPDEGQLDMMNSAEFADGNEFFG
jgi:hypothetical protein